MKDKQSALGCWHVFDRDARWVCCAVLIAIFLSTLLAFSAQEARADNLDGTAPLVIDNTTNAPDLLAQHTGWVKVDGVWKYYDEHHHMVRGWCWDNGAWYYLDPQTGAMATLWVRDNGSWYYLAPDGTLQTGWIYVNRVWYYAKQGGAAATGW